MRDENSVCYSACLLQLCKKSGKNTAVTLRSLQQTGLEPRSGQLSSLQNTYELGVLNTYRI